MINLGDYVGKLLSEISKARVQADLEALRIAELYARDPLLKNFPIPRVRLPKIEIEAPVVVTNAQEDGSVDSADDITDVKKLVSLSETVINKALKAKSITLTKDETTTLNKRLNLNLSKIRPASEDKISVDSVIRTVTDEAIINLRKINTLTTKLDVEQFKEFSTEISNGIKEEISNFRKPLDINRIKISPLTTSLKEVGNNQAITTLKMSIVEDGVEWVKLSDDDTEDNRLVPE